MKNDLFNHLSVYHSGAKKAKADPLKKQIKSGILPGRVPRGEFETFLTINKTKGWILT